MRCCVYNKETYANTYLDICGLTQYLCSLCLCTLYMCRDVIHKNEGTLGIVRCVLRVYIWLREAHLLWSYWCKRGPTSVCPDTQPHTPPTFHPSHAFYTIHIPDACRVTTLFKRATYIYIYAHSTYFISCNAHNTMNDSFVTYLSQPSLSSVLPRIINQMVDT